MKSRGTFTQMVSVPQAHDGEVCLSEILTRVGEERIPLAVSIEIIRQLAEGVAQAWAEAVEPAPIEPDAVFVGFNGRSRLELNSGQGGGKFNVRRRYQSPEMKSGGARTEAADVYGLSALLYELVTGTPVLTAVLRSPLSTVVPAPSTLNPGVDEELDKVLLAAVQFDPRHRTRSATELSAQLAHCLTECGGNGHQVTSFMAALYPEQQPPAPTMPRLDRLRLVPPPRAEDELTPEVAQPLDPLEFEDVGPLISEQPAAPINPLASPRPHEELPPPSPPRRAWSGSVAGWWSALPGVLHKPRLMIALGIGLGFFLGLVVILAKRSPEPLSSDISVVRFAESARLMGALAGDTGPSELTLVFAEGEKEALTTLERPRPVKVVKTSASKGAGKAKKVRSAKRRSRSNAPPPPWLRGR